MFINSNLPYKVISLLPQITSNAAKKGTYIKSSTHWKDNATMAVSKEEPLSKIILCMVA